MAIDRAALDAAIARAQGNILDAQAADGSWDCRGDLGPATTAQVLGALHWLGALPEEDAREGARWLRSQQRPDGGFEPWPLAGFAELGATASVWSALTLANTDEDRAAARHARQWIDAHGGLDAVVDLIATGDVTAWYLSFAGLLDPARLPQPSLAFLLSDTMLHLLQSRVHMGIILGAVQSAVLTRCLRKEWGEAGPELHSLAMKEIAAGMDLLGQWLNGDGSMNGNTPQTALMACTFRAAGIPLDDDRIARNVRWLRAQAVRDSRGLHFDVFSSAVWATAFDLRALLVSGFSPTDARVLKAVRWLVDAQLAYPQPAVDNRHPLAPKTGGYAFQKENYTMADCDDAGVVLSALGLARPHLAPAFGARVDETIRSTHRWLEGMQNPDGGWPAFVYGLGHKDPGPAMTKVPHVSPDNFFELLGTLVDPPLQFVDAATEDVTARVLHGLGATGLGLASPLVQRGLAFLRDQQCASGAFWGRWICNYLPTTGFVLLGAQGVGENLSSEWVQRAARWTLSKQNGDGGWGEAARSYADPATAGEGDTTAPCTGIVLAGLVAAGVDSGPSTEKAAGYLLATQRADGRWDNGDFLITNVPPNGFYTYPESARYMPLEALGRLRASLP